MRMRKRFEKVRSSRRAFLGQSATAVVGTIGTGLFGTKDYLGQELDVNRGSGGRSSGQIRRSLAYQKRLDAARGEHDRPVVQHPTNGDEQKLGPETVSFGKGFDHNLRGEADSAAVASLQRALSSGRPQDFDRILLAGRSRLVNPQAGLGFELEGADPHSFSMKPAPAFSSPEEAGEIGENYVMALGRDVPFSEYSRNPLTNQAAAELTRFLDFRGPRYNGRVTPATLFRGVSGGDLPGPYISQFLWQDTPFGAEEIDRRMKTAAAGIDYMTSYPEWLAIQKGAAAGPNIYDRTPRYIRNGRDLGEWVHRDVLFQAYFNALLILFRMSAPLDDGNPYKTSRTQIGFGTLGDPYIASVLCAVATRALKAVWYQKWFIHRRLRPEVFAGRIHNHVTGAARYPIHSDILNSPILGEVYRRNQSYLLPMAYPEGSPLHPAYGAGHATVAGACVTILKAFFDESFVIPDPIEASPDGLRLIPYNGPDLTLGGELNKLASNVAIGRNFAGVHWRSDATESLKLGEEVAIRFLDEEAILFNETFQGFSLTRFDGTRVTV